MKDKKRKAVYFGKMGEKLAALYLRCLGYRILHRNWRCKLGEIDLIATKQNTLVFFEVKARKSKVSAQNCLRAHQQFRIENAARFFLQRQTRYETFEKRFDLVCVYPPFLIHHVKHIWIPRS